MSGRPRIAIVSRVVSGVTGTTTTIMEHARRLGAQGCEVHVFAERFDAKRMSEAGAIAHWVPGWPWGSRFKRRLFSWLAERAIRAVNAGLTWDHGDLLRQDILSLHNCVHAAHEAVHGGPLPERSGVGWIHDRALRGLGFRLLIANSKLMKRDVAGRFRVPEERISVVYPGHDPRRFKPGDRACGLAVRRRLGVPSGRFLIGLISSGDFAKRGVGRFLEALQGLRPDLKERLHALVMGRESRLGPYRRLGAATGLGDRLHFLAPVDDVAAVYHALDLYVHPALYEEFGQSVQEAMACEVPVLTNERVGAAELLEERDWESVLPDAAVPTLRAGLERFLRDPGFLQGWGTRCREAVKANTWDRNFALTWECLRPLLPLSRHQ